MRRLEGLCVILLCLTTAINATENERQAKFGFLGSSTALTKLAQDLFTRSSSSSQVLSLNLTNLVILLVIKALIFGAGSLGLGGHGGIGRSAEQNLVESEPFVTESELLLILSYLKGDSTQKFGCLHRVACEDPKKAKEYMTTGKILLKASELFQYNFERYNKLLDHLQEAILFGQKGHDCSIRYICAEDQ